MVTRSRFEELALPLREAAYNLACWIVGDRDEAEDVVQEAYVRAYRAFGGFRGDAMRPWLLAIVRNEAYRALRKKRRAHSVLALSADLDPGEAVDADDVPSAAPSAEALLVAAEEREQLFAALATLPHAYREAVVLRDLEGLSYAEIAEVAGIALGTVMSRLSRARSLLRAALQPRLARDRSDAM